MNAIATLRWEDRAELTGTIHGPMKFRFAYEMLPATTCFGFVDGAGVQLGVDRHLLAWHRIKDEASRVKRPHLFG